MKLRIGTRGSELAKKQTMLVADALKKNNPIIEVEIIEITTTGDKKQQVLNAKVSDKKEWIYELEQALLRKDIDLAVHSAKDIPNDIENGTVIMPVLKRATPNDCFIGKLNPETGKRLEFKELPLDSVIATSSLRRKAALKHLRSDLQIVDIRGNVPTRIRKLDESVELSGIILASAGIERLGIDIESQIFSIDEMIPAMNQGILAVQYLTNSIFGNNVKDISDENLISVFNSERVCALEMNADCSSAIGIFSYIENAELKLKFKNYAI